MANTIFTQELADTICEHLASGLSLRQIEEIEGMPSKTTILRWLGDDRFTSFRDQYARARDMQAEGMADEILEIADDGRNDWMEIQNRDGENIGWKVNGEAVQRSRLRIDARKWLLSKLLPKKYGTSPPDANGQDWKSGLQDPDPDV
ncbi:terminase small subunit-like protein [Burkholderia vietnamiensis]|uniref:terminase small subunit-like protein n=1 Tax=Burkholderia vietnamiensis TaxID=60552 RepID=UPI001B8E17BF|nr:terminase small subunit protein [Burkholderia vietnamiensis]MBR8007150.1 terminase small subunit protein [Burkholderia vietnamiensis]MCA8447571.1 terminase small subunit protein [Burkholderia vietnamiensis]